MCHYKTRLINSFVRTLKGGTVEQLVPGIVLARLIRVQYETLRTVWKNVILPADPSAQHPRYHRQVVDSWLARSAHWFERPPTIADLIAGRVVLLKPHEVGRLAQWLTPSRLHRRHFRDKSQLPHLQFGQRTFRYSREGIVAFLAKPRAFTTDEVCHILGLKTWNTVKKELVDSGRLVAVHDVAEGYERLLIPHESLVTCVQDLLPEGADAESWIEDQDESTTPLLTGPEAARYVGKPPKEFKVLLDRGRFRFIYSPSRKERLFMTESLLEYVREFPIPLVRVKDYFGISRQAVEHRIARGTLRCSLHAHSSPRRFFEACMPELVRPYLSPGLSPLRWCAARRNPSVRPLITSRQAAKRMGIEVWELERLAESGAVGGIHAPDGGHWRFPPRTIEEWVWSRRERQSNGGQ